MNLIGQSFLVGSAGILVPRALVPMPSTKGSSPPLSQERQTLKPETLGGVRSVLQNFKK